MFRRLRNRFILTAMLLLSAVIIVSFGAIYISTAARLQRIPDEQPPFRGSRLDSYVDDQEVRNYIAQRRQDDADQTLRSLAITLLLTGGVVLAGGFFVSYLLAERAIRPVRYAYDSQRQFIANASHELKTPLAVIDASIEAEITGKKRPSKWLNNIQEETKRMGELIQDLLTLAKFDSFDKPVQQEEFDVTQMLNGVVTEITPLINKKKLTVSTDISSRLKIKSDEKMLRRVVMILIDNAIKYTKSAGAVTIQAKQLDESTVIVIKNTHEMIQADKFAKIFDRFYQVDESQHSRGHGLGLSIAKSAAQRIGVDLVLSQHDGQVIATLTLSSQ